MLMMADEAKEKRSRGEELSVQDAASVDYVCGLDFAQRAARDYFGYI